MPSTNYAITIYTSTTPHDTYAGFGIMCDNTDIYCDTLEYYCDGSVAMWDMDYSPTGTTTSEEGDFLLLEDGDSLLLEDGDDFLLEGGTVRSVPTEMYKNIYYTTLTEWRKRPNSVRAVWREGSGNVEWRHKEI